MSEFDCGIDDQTAASEIPSSSHIMNVDDFVKYSDGVDDRMSEMARNLNEHGRVTWSSWDHGRNFHDDEGSDSEEDSPYSKMPHKVSHKKNKTQKKEHPADKSGNDLSNQKHDILQKKSEEEIDSSRESLLMNDNNVSGQNGVEDLIRKFSVIEILRQKENLRKETIPEAAKLSPRKRNGKEYKESDDKQERETSEAFFGWKKAEIGKKSEEEDKFGNSERSHPQEEDDEINEIVKMLSNSSLIKDYNDIVSLPNKDEDILKAFIDRSEEAEEKKFRSSNKKPEIEFFVDSLLETELVEMPPENVHSDDLTFDWKADIARELRISFDGYEIDDESSFHDWMVFHQGI